MTITATAYLRLAKLVGALLMSMGLGLTLLFVVFLATGANPLAEAAPGFDGVGMLILASLGAFALPLGMSLFAGDQSTSARLQIAACALGLMAVLRLAAFANADLRAAVGVTPLIEFFVLGAIGLVAFFVRPDDESPIELRIEVEVEAPAAEAWRVLGDQFGTIGEWASGLRASSLDGAVGVGAVRTCDVADFGPFSAGRITEEVLEFDRRAMRFTYASRSGMPRMVQAAKNRWSIEALGSDRCRVRSHASIDLHWWALPLATWAGWGMRSGADRFVEELRHRIETGTAHPRNTTTLAPT